MHTRSTPIPKEQKGKLEGKCDLSGVRVQDTDDLSALPKAGKKEIGAFVFLTFTKSHCTCH